jgi:methylenetetrahydrofolate reductase (NADPH)
MSQDTSTLLRAKPTAAGERPPRVSFEVFPPKNANAEQELWATMKRLEPLSPQFVSVTYGALGSTRDETRGTLQRLLAETDLRPAAHLTCYGGTRDQVDAIIQDYWDLGVRHMVSLRGDLPKDMDPAVIADGYQNATELTEAIRRIGDFEVTVAAFPEKHPESQSLAQDIDVLKAKIDAGATRAITQFFFDTSVFYRFVDLVRAAGITIPIIPGVMPIANFKGAMRMAERCNVLAPQSLIDMFAGLDDEPQTRSLMAAAICSQTCRELQAQGFEDLHIYTLNRADLVYAVCRTLGLTDQQKAAA